MNFRHIFNSEFTVSLAARDTGIYVLAIDVVDFIPFNKKHGYLAGDIALRDCLQRISEFSKSDMDIVTLAGDEWALITNCTSQSDAEAIAKNILSFNGNCIHCEGKDIPVYVRIALVKASDLDQSNCVVLFEQMHDILDRLRDSGNTLFYYSK